MPDSIKYGVRRKEAIDRIGSRLLFDQMVAAGWIAPVVKKHRLSLFDAADIAKCWARIRNGEVPPAIETK